jgi:hypothetical protein
MFSCKNSEYVYVNPKYYKFIKDMNQISDFKQPYRRYLEWIFDNIEYKTDKDVHGLDEYWQSWKETVTLGTGDCEDLSILFLEIIETYHGNEGCVVTTNDHAIAYIDGEFYDGTSNQVYDSYDDIERIFTYDELDDEILYRRYNVPKEGEI